MLIFTRIQKPIEIILQTLLHSKKADYRATVMLATRAWDRGRVKTNSKPMKILYSSSKNIHLSPYQPNKKDTLQTTQINKFPLQLSTPIQLFIKVQKTSSTMKNYLEICQISHTLIYQEEVIFEILEKIMKNKVKYPCHPIL